MPSPLTVVAGGVHVAVRLTPRGGSNKLQTVRTEAGGNARLWVAGTAPPEDGKANAALIRLLSKQLRIPKSDMEIISGATARNKMIRIAADSDAEQSRLTEWGASLT